jgi:hypothetical protein
MLAVSPAAGIQGSSCLSSRRIIPLLRARQG